MTRLFNDPVSFADELLEGFVRANSVRVRGVPGGVIRATDSAPGTVAVITGGGSGHYPAFGGLVGHGMAHGAAMGNLFASPSARQISAVARTAEHGGGVLFIFGRYAGDLLNFGQAAQRLTADGIPVRTVPVTDDLSRADTEEASNRRGLAGGLAVIKLAGAAAEAGKTLDEVTDIAERANARTRTLSVAFSGCTLPGADQPLFTVPTGRMSVGMGVHGEPGIAEQAVPTADALAAMLVDRILTDLPSDIPTATGARAAVVLNGLGSVKYEELFVVYRRVAALLDDAGVTVIEPEVGEFFTSFDMAGLSLSVLWLDDELEQLWRLPADSPGYGKQSSALTPAPSTGDHPPTPDAETVPPATEKSQRAARRALAALTAAQCTIDENADELGRIDAIAGDGDHGIGMQRGITAAVAEAERVVALGAGMGTTLRRAADEWADKAGGTSGALWGVALYALGSTIGDEAAPTTDTIATGVLAAEDAIVQLGGAQPGDKTLVDALIPFRQVLQQRAKLSTPLPVAWASAANAATTAGQATADLTPRLGRARTHLERSLGTPDAGAVSLGLIATAVATVLNEPPTHQSEPSSPIDQERLPTR